MNWASASELLVKPVGDDISLLNYYAYEHGMTLTYSRFNATISFAKALLKLFPIEHSAIIDI